MARRMEAEARYVPSTDGRFRNLLQNHDELITAQGYCDNEEAINRRKSAVRLIEKIWKTLDNVDALIPYIAMNYYDILASRAKIPGVLMDNGKNENLFVICCLVTALRHRVTNFNLCLFLNKPELRHYKMHYATMELDVILDLCSNIRTLTPIGFSDYLVKQNLQQSHPQHIQRTRCLVRQLIVKSQADIAMTAFKPSIVAASAVHAICSKLFPGTYDNSQGDDVNLTEINQVVINECMSKIIKWNTGLACNPVENEEPNDDDLGWTELGWTDVVGENDGCFTNLVKFSANCLHRIYGNNKHCDIL